MLYVRSITSLLAWFTNYAAQQCSNGTWQAAPPLVINTHGWIKVAQSCRSRTMTLPALVLRR